MESMSYSGPTQFVQFVKGTMNAMFLKDLADKTRRGLRGRVEKGKSGGGLAYGYKVVKKLESEGQAIRGDREINEEHASIVRRIFEDYAYKKNLQKLLLDSLTRKALSPLPVKAGGKAQLMEIDVVEPGF